MGKQLSFGLLKFVMSSTQVTALSSLRQVNNIKGELEPSAKQLEQWKFRLYHQFVSIIEAHHIAEY